MHRSIRWLVGTLASILGLGLLLVRWGLWASDSRLVVENTPPVRSMLIAARNEPAFLIYGTVVFLLLVGFALPNGGSGLLATSRIGLNRLVGGIVHHLQNLSGGICATPVAEAAPSPPFLALIARRFRVMLRGERNSDRSPSCPSSDS